MWLQMLYIRQSTTHVRMHATGYKPLSCKQCYYECKQLSALTHERIHTNKKRFIQDARIAFTNILGHSQEPTIYYSSKELCSDQNLTSDFSGLLKNPLMKAALWNVFAEKERRRALCIEEGCAIMCSSSDNTTHPSTNLNPFLFSHTCFT